VSSPESVSAAAAGVAPAVLTIAESDPSGAGGLQGDLATFAAIGVYAMAVPTALTVQDSDGVRAVHPLDPRVAAQSITALLERGRVDAVKIGALHTAAMAEAVHGALSGFPGPVVLDPVTHRVARRKYVDQALRELLLMEMIPRATVVTPNLNAASALCRHPIRDIELMIAAASALQIRGADCVLVKGGGLAGDPVDALVTEASFALLWGTRHDLPRTKGGGSAISAAIAAALARGEDPRDACIEARIRLDRALDTDHVVGRGTGSISHHALRLTGRVEV